MLTAWLGAMVILCAGCAKPSNEDTLTKVRKAGVIRWGADDSGGGPFVYKDPDNPSRSIGFEVDMMDALARHMGLKHEMVVNQWEELIPTLQAGRCDIVVNGIEINPERRRQVLFSLPYYAYEQQLTVRRDDKDKYKTLADLKGKKIATLSGAQANDVLKEAGWTVDLIQPMPDSQTPYDELENKRVDAVLQESIIAAFYANPQKKPDLYNLPNTFAPGQYAIAIRTGDETLQAEIDRALKLMMDNGELAEIYRRWGIWTDGQTQLGIKSKGPATRP